MANVWPPPVASESDTPPRLPLAAADDDGLWMSEPEYDKRSRKVMIFRHIEEWGGEAAKVWFHEK